MSQDVLVFFPTGLNTPEAEVLSSTIQSLLDKKKTRYNFNLQGWKKILLCKKYLLNKFNLHFM